MSSRLARLPRWISHWLGYRPETAKPLPAYQIALWSFIIAFCGLSVVQAIFNYSEYFQDRNVPGIIASYVSGEEANPIQETKINKRPGCIRCSRIWRN